MRRRLISILAAALAAGTLFGTAGAASASGAAVHHRADCQIVESLFLHVTKNGVNYWAGTPNTTFPGATVRLKPTTNNTTRWLVCEDFTAAGDEYVFFNRNLVMTSSGVPGSNVTMEHVGNLGNGTLRQRWFANHITGTTITLRNVRSGQYLRVRNSGPIMGQTVTTGFTPTFWLH